ncbi:MAG: phosphatase PAP2 family protein [Lachnospiraceae bacterium]|jgi:membrane-associated phospholipid phosphatase|nr:phosphatase PAP2 family protein [Lachnospiraceae bacterium]
MRKYQLLDSFLGNRPLLAESPSSALLCRIRLAMPMALYMLFYCVTFALIENWNRLHYTIIHTAVDDLIPFCEVFIIPYLMWFAYSVGFTFYLFLKDEKSYHEIGTFLAIGMTAFLAVSIIFPNILMLRPETMPRDNIFTDLCRMLYAVDTPTNVSPSIHVYNSIAVMIAVWKTDARLVRSRFAKVLMTFLGFTIILSTMFLKQHSFSDVVIATGLALVSYILVYKMGFVFIRKRQRRVRYRSVYEH